MMRVSFVYFALSFLLFSCTTTNNSPDFIKEVSGRYLFNSDAIIEIYFIENDLFIKWQGAEKIKPMKLNDSIFFIKEMNEKIHFTKNPADQKLYISLVSKESDLKTYNYRKLNSAENIPKHYLNNKEYDKALLGYLQIQSKDSLDSSINEFYFNSRGYDELRKNNIEDAIQIFNINAALFPKSSNTFDSLGEAYLKNGDTINSLENYQKALLLDSGNRRIKNQIEELENKN